MIDTTIRHFLCGALAFSVGLTAGTAQSEMVIDMLPVGNAGNAADTRFGTPYGAVGYEYQIGKFEVTAAQYTVFLNAVASSSDPYGLYKNPHMGNTSIDYTSGRGCNIQRTFGTGGYTYSVASDWANRPVNYVSWYDAARFTNWMTTGTTEQGVYTFTNGLLTGIMDHQEAGSVYGTAYFLPTADEWYKAAYHDKSAGTAGTYFSYPTGTNAAPNNFLADPDPGNCANYGESIGSPYYRTEVGACENSASPYGTFDQGGNVFEWNERLFDTFRGLSGGSFATNMNSLAAGSFSGAYGGPTTETNRSGFRVASVASVPEPGTIALLVSGGLAGLLVCWYRK